MDEVDTSDCKFKRDTYLIYLARQSNLKYPYLVLHSSRFNYNYTEQNYKHNIFVFAPIFHELNSKNKYFIYVHKRPISLKYCSQIGLNLC